jgi:hypothetical protein
MTPQWCHTNVMELTRYIADLQHQLEVAADAGGDEARALAERLIAPLEAATRLVLLEALSAAASEITRELAPGSVDVRLRGREPEFVVTPAPAGVGFVDVTEQRPGAAPALSLTALDDAADGGTSRTTQRLPDTLKLRVEEAAAREGLSVNTWLVRAVATALEGRERQPVQRDSGGGERYTGWVR